MRWKGGDQGALKDLLPLVYNELRRLAHHQLRAERQNHTLQSTALVHEAYLRLVDNEPLRLDNRAHFFAVASHLMRQVLTDHARTRNAGKRGGGHVKVPLETALNRTGVAPRQPRLLSLDEALDRLARRRPLRSKLIELRFFGGLTAEESAEVVQLPVKKVLAELRIAQAWLHLELQK